MKVITKPYFYVVGLAILVVAYSGHARDAGSMRLSSQPTDRQESPEERARSVINNVKGNDEVEFSGTIQIETSYINVEMPKVTWKGRIFVNLTPKEPDPDIRLVLGVDKSPPTGKLAIDILVRKKTFNVFIPALNEIYTMSDSAGKKCYSDYYV
ncbi:MAG TPA: hypothetical protein VN937_24095, partial [Blastocatellia bacterium]|nr:hypothetical protein [Blastocatellia bacterium]